MLTRFLFKPSNMFKLDFRVPLHQDFICEVTSCESRRMLPLGRRYQVSAHGELCLAIQPPIVPWVL